jgi:hypothetical protein
VQSDPSVDVHRRAVIVGTACRTIAGSYCGHPERLHHRCSSNVLLCELGHQARQANQEDIPTPRTDTQSVFLCRPPLVEMAVWRYELISSTARPSPGACHGYETSGGCRRGQEEVE